MGDKILKIASISIVLVFFVLLFFYLLGFYSVSFSINKQLIFFPTETQTPQPTSTFTLTPTLTKRPTNTLTPTLAPTKTITPTKTTRPTKTTDPEGKWFTYMGKSSFDDSTSVDLELKANTGVSGWPNNSYTPRLHVRCLEGKKEVYIDVGMSFDVEYGLYGRATVRIRFDSNEAFELIGTQSTDGEALFFDYPNNLIDKMLVSEKMTFGFTPFNSSPVSTTFDLFGLAEAIKPLNSACK
ncbi:MAG: hypothetical protein CL609_22820 [Anaerolineaceae bacterium]|nr:hypothetical protein [Anaerolineaceae bacterium]